MLAHMAANTPAFQVKARDGKARTGVLVTKHGSIQTPAVLLYTRRGAPLSLTPDLIQTLEPPIQGAMVNIMHFLAHPSPSVLHAHGGGAHSFLGLGEQLPVVASNRDPTQYEFGGRPSSNKEVYVHVHNGGHMVTPEKYMDVVAALQPDIFVTMCDEVTADAKPKRVAASLERNAAWLGACLEQHRQRGAAGLPLAAIGGAASVAERGKAAQAVADKEVAGFAVCGLGTGEPPEQRPMLLAAALAPLPPAKPVLALGASGSPEELLEAVAAGVDLLDMAYAAQVTGGGYALRFPLQPPAGWQQQPQEQHRQQQQQQEEGAALRGAGAGAGDDDEGSDDTKLNLWAPAYRTDKGPLLPGCGCFACRNHSRAYVHHLLQAHEMLAEVLLELHNTHHMLVFMQAVRQAIEEGRLQQYCDWFRSLRTAAMAPAPVRAHFKRRALGSSEKEAGDVAAAATAGAEGGPAEPAAGDGAGARPGAAKWVRV